MTATRDLLPVSIAGRHYQVDLSRFERRPVDAQREPVDQQAEPSESSFSPTGVWKRNGEDFVEGTGQEWYDLVEESSRRRFSTSLGVNPWERRQFSLLNQAQAMSTAGAGWLVVAGGKLFWAYESVLKEVVASSSTHVWDDSGANLHDADTEDWLDVISTGSALFLTDGTHLYRYRPGTDAETIEFGTDVVCQVVGYANGRLIVADDGELFELDPAGSPTSIWEHFDADWTWTTIASSPQGIYVGGYSGNHSEIYIIGVDETDGSLTIPRYVGALPDGELINMVLYYTGVVILGTTLGFRVAQLGVTGELNYGSVISIPEGVSVLEPFGSYVWFNWNNLRPGQFQIFEATATLVNSPYLLWQYEGDDVPEVGQVVTLTSCADVPANQGSTASIAFVYVVGSEVTLVLLPINDLDDWDDVDIGDEISIQLQAGTTGLGRMDLSRFTSDGLVPAYATDLTTRYAPDAPSVVGPVTSVVIYGDRLYFVVSTDGDVDTLVDLYPAENLYPAEDLYPGAYLVATSVTGGGPQQEQQTPVDLAELLTSKVTFGTVELKQLTSVEVSILELGATGSVMVIVMSSDGSTDTRTITSIGVTKWAPSVPMSGEWFQLLFSVDGNDEQVVIERWTLRGLPAPYRIEDFYVPLIISSEQQHNDQSMAMVPHDELVFLEQLYNQRTPVEFVFGESSYQVYVDGLIQTGELVDGWDPREAYVDGILMVKLRTIEGRDF